MEFKTSIRFFALIFFIVISFLILFSIPDRDDSNIISISANAQEKPSAENPFIEKSTAEKSSVEKSSVEKPAAEKPPIEKSKKGKTQYFTLNFKDTELSEFLNVMSQLVGKNIVIDDKIKGKITISSVKKIPVSHAFEIMKSILEVKELAVIETPSLIKIVPMQDAVKKNAEIIIDGKKHRMSSDDESMITYLLKLENADANEIASTLKSLKSKGSDIVVYSTLNTLILSGTTSEVNGLIKIAKALDKKVEEEGVEPAAKGNIHVIHLENADAEQLAGVLARVPFSEQAKIAAYVPPAEKVKTSPKAQRATHTQQTQAPSQPATKLSIIANKETNSLIITATPEEFIEIKRLIKELDTVREQVLIEALIIEVSAENGWSFGIDWMMGNQSGQHLYGGSQILGNAPDYSTSEVRGKEIVLPLASGFQLGYLSDRDMLGFALLNLSETDSNFNLLSTPQILTVDNHEAELNIGEEIPVPSNNRISDSGTQFYTFDYKSVGIKLKITPHITRSSSITLDLYQEVNSVLGQTTVAESGTMIPPKLGKRDIATKITVADGKTIVVGGLISNDKIEEETKVPLLGDIPLLGWLFKRKSVEYKKRNLLVFITPHIVTKPEKADAVTEQKREEQGRLKFK